LAIGEAFGLQTQVLIFFAVEDDCGDLLIVVEGTEPEVDILATLQPANAATATFWTEPISLGWITKGESVSSRLVSPIPDAIVTEWQRRFWVYEEIYALTLVAWPDLNHRFWLGLDESLGVIRRR